MGEPDDKIAVLVREIRSEMRDAFATLREGFDGLLAPFDRLLERLDAMNLECAGALERAQLGSRADIRR